MKACKRQRKEGEETTMILPPDIITSIFLQLPAESLIQLKNVCKSFSNLISDSNFTYNHLRNSYDHQEQSIVIELSCCSPAIHDYFSVKLLRGKEEVEVKQFKTYRKFNDLGLFKNEVLLKASCDGLVLLQRKKDHNQLYISNPVTRRCRKLPALKGKVHIWNWVLARDGIGYKIVGISSNSRRCSVLKVGKSISSWNEVYTPYQDSHLLSSQSPTFINKEFHWLMLSHQSIAPDSPYERFIYSINLAGEEIGFRETKVPYEITCKYDHNSILEVKEVLCLTDSLTSCNQLDIWSLNDKDKSNCKWVKSYKISLEFQISNPTRVYSFRNSRRSVILIHHKNQLLVYDLESKKCRSIDKFNKKKEIFTRCPFMHIDSLVNWE
ncbi:hypothetical protein ACHQM5_006019 [Ranunculus cassubicifolius]